MVVSVYNFVSVEQKCHKTYLIIEVNRNTILGLDWLKDNNIRIYMDLIVSE